MRVALVGSRDLAQQMAGYLVQAPDIEVAGFFDDFRPSGETTPHGPVLGPLSGASAARDRGVFDSLALGVGYRHLQKRGEILTSLLGAIPLLTYVHPSGWVDSTAKIGEGAFLLPGCCVDANATIGAGSVLNVGCVVCHDSVIEENCFLGPSVTIAGFTRVGRGCFLGVGTVVIDNVSIAPRIQTGGGAVVVNDLTEPGLYLGVPARRRG
jgi:sugar O-acyltransferase (sialic acid O-acetyltransferase NeuD family)